MSRLAYWSWSPAAVLVVGAVMTLGVDRQTPVPLRASLDSVVPAQMDGHASRDIVISDQELRVAGVTSYLLREYFPAAGATPLVEMSEPPVDAAASERTDDVVASFSVYVGYYDSQTQGRTIHSPKNCLPGSGWEALASREITLETDGGPIPANRYLLQRDEQKALVVYWYQGRGRVEANEYLVKAQLLRDAALYGRTEEALVRIVVPIVTTEEAAFEIASRAARDLVPTIDRALPARA